ncbi:restriction endonuclease subunit S [Aliarcobacter skirrowii]|uniref:restriction endonuclease subunit S n=1 Tax=Aliarcobacter skirrowii TaxID=28200 RepID=UPI002A366E22|nr:restriction endonuclease subunit S [Aliarcobacter skirrowii]MDY0181266.1 restriction endonuclease subunit S [Aliarcobacter skirrowii]
MQVLEKYFDTAFDAPDGIKKLRELILTLAMQGKLVPQDPNDQPASELLKEIGKEKDQLIKEKKIKKIAIQSEIKIEKIDFQIPKSWEWVKFGNIAHQITDGAHHTPTYINEGVPFLSVKDMSSGVLDFSNTRYISHEQHKDLAKRCNPQNGDLLLTKVGTTGIPILINTDKEFSIFVSVALIKFPKQFISGDFLVWLINSPFVKKQSADGTEGVGNKNLVLKKINNFTLPIPPLNEQKRIVEKINQLMALCDELEKLKEQKEAKKLTVHKSAINQLLDSKDDSNSQKGWHFISNHFNDLYTVKENVSELRSAILQLAMQGKLVPQDPNEQPASELLKKLKKIKNIPEVNSNEMSFSLPQSWEWERIVNLGITQTGTTPPKKDPDNYGNFIPFIGPGNIKNGIIDYSGEGLSEKGIEKGRLIKKDSILMVCIGGSIGKHAMTNQDISCNQQINTITVYPELSTQYVYWAMASQYFQNTVINQAGGSATPIINKLKWSSIPIPVPPYNEQQRIVEKINQLMALCDDLEKQIENSSSKQTQLLNAIMSNLGK